MLLFRTLMGKASLGMHVHGGLDGYLLLGLFVEGKALFIACARPFLSWGALRAVRLASRLCRHCIALHSEASDITVGVCSWQHRKWSSFPMVTGSKCFSAYQTAFGNGRPEGWYGDATWRTQIFESIGS